VSGGRKHSINRFKVTRAQPITAGMRTPARRIAARLAAAVSLGVCLLGVGEAAAHARSQPLDLNVTARLVPDAVSILHYRGTFTGAPFGRGKVDVRAKMSGAGDADIRFTLSTSRGTMRGVGKATATYRGSIATVVGTVSLSRGTGAYRRFRAPSLRLSGSTSAADVLSKMRVTGAYTS
jgi:hypothetical protein